MKEIFKVGDKVYHISYGWGIVKSIDIGSFPVIVSFEIKGYDSYNISFSKDGIETSEDKTSLLSFTEYTLQGFSQERPIELPEVGEDVLVYDGYNSEWILRQFQRYVKCSVYPFHVTDRDSFLSSQYSKMKRIKILD